MQIETLKFAKLSGIIFPAEKMDPVILAQADIARTEREIQTIEDEIKKLTDPPLKAGDIQDALATGRLSGFIAGHLKQSAGAAATRGMLAEARDALREQLATHKAELEQAEAELRAWLEVALRKNLRKMQAEVQRARLERARDMGTTRTYPASRAPEEPGRSSVAVCEKCMEPVGVVDLDTIKQPVAGKDFGPLPNGGQPFPTTCDWEWLVCPVCRRRRPFEEPDRILVSDGFFMLPKAPGEKSEGAADA